MHFIVREKYFGLIRNGFWRQCQLNLFYTMHSLLYYSYPQLEGACPSAEVIARYHMQDACEAFEKLRELFGYLVSDEAQVMMGRAFSIDSTMDYISNVKKLMK